MNIMILCKVQFGILSRIITVSFRNGFLWVGVNFMSILLMIENYNVNSGVLRGTQTGNGISLFVSVALDDMDFVEIEPELVECTAVLH